MNTELFHGRLRQNPAPLYMALLRTLRLTLTSRVIKKLLADGNTLKLPPLEEEDIVSFQKTKLVTAWSNLQHTDLTSFTQQLLHLEKLYQTTLMPAADVPAVRATLTDVQRTMDLLPSHALVPVGVYLVMVFLEMFLVENEPPQAVETLVAVYIHAWRWLRLLFRYICPARGFVGKQHVHPPRPGNISQLMIESSSHMLSLVVLVKLRQVLKTFATQNVSIQKFYAMLTLLVKSMPSWQDLAKFLEPKNWFKKVEQHFLGLRAMYLPKALLDDLQAIPPFDLCDNSFWATNGLAFVEGNMMGMSLDVEQRNIAANQQRDPALHAFSNAQANAPVRNIDFNVLQFPLPMKNTVQFVSCGYRHAAVITTRAELFTLGYGECGRLGHGDENAVTQPKHVDFFTGIPVSHVSCGREHTMVVTADERVFGFGWGEAGRLGTGESGKCLQPSQVTNVPPVSKVACGREHTLMLCTSGQVLACGAGYGGRCGVGSEDDVPVATPVVIENTPVIVAIDAGECHSAAIDRDGNVYTWGFGGSGALGRGSLENDVVPLQVPLLKASSVGCGAYHTVAVLLDGTVYGWGDALAGQLGDIAVTLGDMRTTPHKISIGQVVATQVSCGSFTTAIVSITGEVRVVDVGGHAMNGSRCLA
ncbi:hypothetical protein DYB32_003555 [Aphanomyces invadans]|uniref:RCC1-like domain-containing protein n=1 Tax=Aphanomyces invadans TaxID=157072 RepID=A0A418B096_9STRA|nr:hypothetical protein DYB32_003555 [Aphanomyces invadans]